MPTRGSGPIGYAELQQYMGGSNPIYNSEYRGVDGSWAWNAIYDANEYYCRPRPWYNPSGTSIGSVSNFGSYLRVNASFTSYGGGNMYFCSTSYYPSQFDGQWINYGPNPSFPRIYRVGSRPYMIWQNHNGVSGYRTILPYYWTYSDIRLKDHIQYLRTENGHRLYTWTWNKLANTFGLVGESAGVLAQEIKEYMPMAVKKIGKYYQVNYNLLWRNGK